MPSVTTTYVVNSASPGVCLPNSDTVTVTVDTALTTHPTVAITANPGNVPSPGLNITFTAAVTDCANPTYVWMVNGVDIPGNDTSSWSSATLSVGDSVSCRVLCADPCASGPYTMSNYIVMVMTTGVNTAASNRDVIIYPNPSNGSFSLKASDAIFSNAQVSVTNVMGQVVYKETLDIYNSKQTVDLQNTPTGNYILHINQHTYKIMVTK